VIRTNLATRPFYHDGAVRLVLLAIAALGLAATAFNVTRIVQLSQRDTQLLTQATRDESQARDVSQRAVKIRATIDPRVLELASADARQANELIDRRTFSWTDLLNRLETTLPDDVRVATLRPKLDPKRGIVLTIIVFARNVDDINLFIDKLETTGAFAQLQKLDERTDEQSQLQATIEGVYTPMAAHPSAEGEGADR
jgi:Tfp pilus assembly protein PilN